MAMQSAIATIGFAKQTAKGTAASDPVYLVGLADGGVFSDEIEQDLADVTSGTRAAPGVDRTGYQPGVDYGQRCYAASIGLLLYAVLGGKSVTGSGTYTHTITGANTLPYLTFFGDLDGTKTSVEDCRIDELTISWDGPGPVEVSVSGAGTDIGFPSSPSATTDETRAAYLSAAGGTFEIDVDGTSPATAKVKAGEITIKNNLDKVQLAASITPDDQHPGRREVEISLTVVPDNLNDWRTTVTGSAAGTTVSDEPVYGSFEITFIDGTNSLELESLRVAFVTEFPDADPSGGPVELELTGLAVLPLSSGEQITATLINSVASY